MVCSIALALLYVIGLGAFSQLSGLYEELPKYGQRIGDLVDTVQQKITAMEDQTYKVVVPARQRQEEDRRMRRALLARYPNAAVHDVERAKALKTASDAMTNGQRRIAQLQDDRQKLAAETEYYKDPAKWPLKLKRQIEQNEQETALQQRYVVTQQEEKTRINARFDEELTRLNVLWAQSQATTAAAAPASASATVRR